MELNGRSVTIGGEYGLFSNQASMRRCKQHKKKNSWLSKVVVSDLKLGNFEDSTFLKESASKCCWKS
jgi:hypothetical protein